ncbi:LADA_0B02278g1_1 [Lachancea dasiensis]|uniref:LADA_0B02278g1_1 n=1 Tax=Lachancea dasiensis TaxID=1072105 RepID=A0A1G4IS16_9SACH|nr:LADA_0B02278g1_1 [Lachancea dasiensis]
MADPFANLFTSFKGGKNEAQKNSKPRESDVPRSPTPTTPGREQGSKQSCDIDLLFSPGQGDELVKNDHSGSSVKRPSGPTVSRTGLDPNIGVNMDMFSPTPPPQEATKDPRDDFDDVFETFNSTPLQSVPETAASTPKDDNVGNVLIDEVKDMEIAKLMSLGLDVENASQYYDRGFLYEHVLEKDRQPISRKLSSKEKPSDEPDLFSMASSWIGKGRTFLDSTFKQKAPGLETGFLTEYVSTRSGSPNTTSSQRLGPQNHNDLVDAQRSANQNKFAFDEHDSIVSRPASAPGMPATKTAATLGHAASEPNSPPHFGSHGEPQEVLLDFDAPMPSHTLQKATTIKLSQIERHGFEEYKAKASESFTAGDYPTAYQNYEKSLNNLQQNHPWRIVSYSNMIVCQLKLGDYRQVLKNASSALDLIPPNIDENIPDLSPPKTFKTIWSKIVCNKAEALERLEDYANALLTYQQLIEKGIVSSKILDARRRCQKIVEPEKFTVAKKSKRPPTPSQPPVSGQSDLETKRARALQNQNRQAREEDEKRFIFKDDVERKISQWCNGNQSNLRELLARLHLILDWCGWKEVAPTALVMPKKVKVYYLKAAAKTHPDKVQESWPLERKMIAENVFVILSKAWESFKEENDMT